MMERLTRRTVAVILGLSLGWWIAGLAPHFVPGVGMSFAGEAQSTSPSVHTVEDDHGDASGSGHSGGRAGHLVPREADTFWYKPVLIAVISLFVAAIVLGIPALRLRGPEPPESADPTDAAHDHDAQSH